MLIRCTDCKEVFGVDYEPHTCYSKSNGQKKEARSVYQFENMAQAIPQNKRGTKPAMRATGARYSL